MPATGRNRMEYHMPRTPRNPGPPSLYFVVFGVGEASLENITALLDDYIQGQGEVTPKFVIPVDKELTTATIQDVAAYAQAAGYSYEVLHAEAFGRTKAFKAIGDEAGTVTKVESIEEAMIERLVKYGQDGILLFLWDEDDAQVPNEADQRFLYDVFEQAPEALVLELSGGLEQINPPETDGSAEDPEAQVGEADPEPDAEPVAGTGDDTTYEQAEEWPMRKLRAWALDTEIHGSEALTSDKTDDMTREELLDYFFPEDDADGEAAAEPEAEPEPPAAPARGRTRQTPSTEAAGPARGSRTRATQIREDVEQETGEQVTAPAARKTAAAAKKTGTARVEEQKAKDKVLAGEALDRLAGRSGDEAQADPMLEFVDLYADRIADIIIDRIAARVESEPVDSAIRKEVAPPRPPGRPRADGEAPVRRTATTRSRR